MKKKFLWTILTTLCSLLMVSAVFADDRDSDVIVSLQIDNPMMKVNGVEMEIDEGKGTKPVVIDGRTFVPIRAIIEAFGGEVGWDESTKSVLLTMGDDMIRLVIDSTTAYLNDKEATLDVAPAIINGCTMLPIRFIAEGFNFGVSWNQDAETVSVLRYWLDGEEYEELTSEIPAYSGSPYAYVNNNIPYFKEYEIIEGSFAYYSSLDELGRCNVCVASIASDIMPTEKRESESSVTPTGWKNAVYDEIDGNYLYNRCRLIGYQLTGGEANERNLITGTKYFNVEGMLPFENMVDKYIEQTGNRVMYRVTPVFKEDNLVADGALLEAYSVEDGGKGISFCVYCYNVQPGIKINYKTGDNQSTGGNEKKENHAADLTFTETAGVTGTTGITGTSAANETAAATGTSNTDASYLTAESKVYRTPSGKKYHIDPDCGGENSYEVTLGEATKAKLTPCKKCVE